jgi:hypothetical protein
MRTKDGLTRSVCNHLEHVNDCPVQGCPHNDTRPLVQQVFGRFPNSKVAQRLYTTDKVAYDALRKEAQELGLLSFGVVPKALRDE